MVLRKKKGDADACIADDVRISGRNSPFPIFYPLVYTQRPATAGTEVKGFRSVVPHCAVDTPHVCNTSTDGFLFVVHAKGHTSNNIEKSFASMPDSFAVLFELAALFSRETRTIATARIKSLILLALMVASVLPAALYIIVKRLIQNDNAFGMCKDTSWR